jgi:2-haloacid dehalogenase
VTTAVSAVVFDLGGVLIDWDPRYLYRQLFDGDEDGMERFLAEVCTPSWNAEQDAGRPWAEAVELLVREHPEERDRIEAYHLRWEQTLGGAIEETVDVLRELREEPVRLFALSNWSAETFPIARRRYPFLGWFDGIVISGEVGICKPDERVFRHLITTYGLEPRSTVFVDDSEVNVDAARALGMTAIQFTSGSQLRDELRRLGVLDHLEVARGDARTASTEGSASARDS